MRRSTPEFIEELIPLVKEEADKIKRYASETEIAKLNPATIYGHSKCSCVYGQMTGDCNSDRALHLISECCNQVYVKGYDGHVDKLNGHSSEIKCDKMMNDLFGRDSVYLSPIEQIIFGENLGRQAGRRIAQYIKGEIDELKLDDIMIRADQYAGHVEHS